MSLVFVLIGLSLMGNEATCGGDEIELINMAEFQVAPVWSKDGSQLIISHPPSGLFAVDFDGSNVRAIPSASSVGNVSSPGSFAAALSPDGSRLAYAMDMKGDDTSDIVTSAIDGSDLRRLTNDGCYSIYPVWSPDGSRIAFVSDRAGTVQGFHLYVMDADGSNVRSVAPSLESWGLPPAWSPDGSRIASIADRRGEEDLGRGTVLFSVRPDGSGLTELGNTASYPAWSPDGDRIAFIRRVETGGQTYGGLWTVEGDGSNPRELQSFSFSSPDEIPFYSTLSWSPDGSQILYGTDGFFMLLSVDRDYDRAAPVAYFPRSMFKSGSGETISPIDVRDVAPTTVPQTTPTTVPQTTPTTVSYHFPSAPTGRAAGAAWSPDGSRIAFFRSTASLEKDVVVLYTTSSDGSDKRVLLMGDDPRIAIEQY